MSPDIFRWGGGLPREGVGAKKFGMALETREIKLFWRDIPGFCSDIPAAPEKFEKKSLCSILAPIKISESRDPDVRISLTPGPVLDREWPGCPRIWVGMSQDLGARLGHLENFLQETFGLILFVPEHRLVFWKQLVSNPRYKLLAYLWLNATTSSCQTDLIP